MINQNYALNFLCFIRACGSLAIDITSNTKVACSSLALVNRWLCCVHRQKTYLHYLSSLNCNWVPAYTGGMD